MKIQGIECRRLRSNEILREGDFFIGSRDSKIYKTVCPGTTAWTENGLRYYREEKNKTEQSLTVPYPSKRIKAKLKSKKHLTQVYLTKYPPKVFPISCECSACKNPLMMLPHPVETCSCLDCQSERNAYTPTIVEIDDRIVTSSNAKTVEITWSPTTSNIDIVLINGVKYVREQSIGQRITEWFFKYIIDRRCF